MPIRVGDVIRASDGGKPEPRPGVVLRVHTIDGVEWAFVAFGSRQPPKTPDVKAVTFTRRDYGFVELRLDSTTHFKETHSGRIPTDDDNVIVYGPCPDSIFVSLKALFNLK